MWWSNTPKEHSIKLKLFRLRLTDIKILEVKNSTFWICASSGSLIDIYSLLDEPVGRGGRIEMRLSLEAKGQGFSRRSLHKLRRAGRKLELGENRLLPERRRSAGWRLRLWKHRGKGAGLDFTV